MFLKNTTMTFGGLSGRAPVSHFHRTRCFKPLKKFKNIKQPKIHIVWEYIGFNLPEHVNEHLPLFVAHLRGVDRSPEGDVDHTDVVIGAVDEGGEVFGEGRGGPVKRNFIWFPQFFQINVHAKKRNIIKAKSCVKLYFLKKKNDTCEGNCCRLDVRKIPPAVHHPDVEEVWRRGPHPVVQEGVAGGEGEGDPALHLGDGGAGGVVGEVQVEKRLLAGNDLVVSEEKKKI